MPRRDLGLADAQAILTGLIDEYLTEAQRYDQLGQADAAARLRDEADTLRIYL
ncbi:hypothetical protein ACWDTI_07715 [Gordonia sp. NPDC003424]